MAPMNSGQGKRVRDAVWEGLGPAFVSWLVDLLRAVMFWVGIGLLHLLQLLILSFGWSPTFVHYLDVSEECAVFASAISFFFSSAVAFFWATWKRTTMEFK